MLFDSQPGGGLVSKVSKWLTKSFRAKLSGPSDQNQFFLLLGH